MKYLLGILGPLSVALILLAFFPHWALPIWIFADTAMLTATLFWIRNVGLGRDEDTDDDDLSGIPGC